MNAIAGLGSSWAVVSWLVAFGIAAGFLVRQAAQGRPVSTTTYAVLFWFILPILLQYPFTFSPLNIVFSTGPKVYDAYVPYVDRALLASLAGMAAFVVARVSVSGRARAFAPVRLVRYGIAGWTSSALIWLSLGVVTMLLAPFALMSFAGLADGAAGARAVALRVPAIRPLYHIVATVLPILLSMVLLLAHERRRRSLWVVALLLFGLATLTGSRAAAFTGVLTAVLATLAHRSLHRDVPRRTLVRYALLAVPAMLLILYLGEIRHGRFNPLTTVANFASLLLYGNNFSDLRDFAWVLAYWNEELFLGRTQLAGVLGLIPTVLSSFRAEWGFGRVTTNMTGITFGEVDASHPGLRPGMFGESYLNFGFVGVIAAGLLLGWICARLDAHAALARDEEPAVGRLETRLTLLATFTTLFLLANFFITAGFYAVYVTIGVLAGVRLLRAVLRAALAGHARGRTAPAHAAPPPLGT